MAIPLHAHLEGRFKCGDIICCGGKKEGPPLRLNKKAGCLEVDETSSPRHRVDNDTYGYGNGNLWGFFKERIRKDYSVDVVHFAEHLDQRDPRIIKFKKIVAKIEQKPKNFKAESCFYLEGLVKLEMNKLAKTRPTARTVGTQLGQPFLLSTPVDSDSLPRRPSEVKSFSDSLLGDEEVQISFSKLGCSSSIDPPVRTVGTQLGQPFLLSTPVHSDSLPRRPSEVKSFSDSLAGDEEVQISFPKLGCSSSIDPPVRPLELPQFGQFLNSPVVEVAVEPEERSFRGGRKSRFCSVVQIPVRVLEKDGRSSIFSENRLCDSLAHQFPYLSEEDIEVVGHSVVQDIYLQTYSFSGVRSQATADQIGRFVKKAITQLNPTKR